eukprot:10472908-Alexandrium_andersonii.AAC.1
MVTRGQLALRAPELQVIRSEVRVRSLPRAATGTGGAAPGQQRRRSTSGPGGPPLTCPLPPRRRCASPGRHACWRRKAILSCKSCWSWHSVLRTA